MFTTRELTEIRKELEERRDDLRNTLTDGPSSGPADGDNRDRNDLANEYRSRDRRAALRSMDEQLLAQVDHALARMDDGNYGTCEQCNRAIAPERLDFLPQATLCMECQTAADT